MIYRGVADWPPADVWPPAAAWPPAAWPPAAVRRLQSPDSARLPRPSHLSVSALRRRSAHSVLRRRSAQRRAIPAAPPSAQRRRPAISAAPPSAQRRRSAIPAALPLPANWPTSENGDSQSCCQRILRLMFAQVTREDLDAIHRRTNIAQFNAYFAAKTPQMIAQSELQGGNLLLSAC